jgi:hypothetical protein
VGWVTPMASIAATTRKSPTASARPDRLYPALRCSTSTCDILFLPASSIEISLHTLLWTAGIAEKFGEASSRSAAFRTTSGGMPMRGRREEETRTRRRISGHVGATRPVQWVVEGLAPTTKGS